MPAQRFDVFVGKEYLKFNAAHFIAYPGFRERLHGHNYHVTVRLEGELGPARDPPGSARPRANDQRESGPALEHALALEPGVGLRDRHRIEAELGRERPRRGHGLAGPEHSGRGEEPDLVLDLAMDGNAAVSVESEEHGVHR